MVLSDTATVSCNFNPNTIIESRFWHLPQNVVAEEHTTCELWLFKVL